MARKYFIDESGNSGDIATLQATNDFAGQPIFTLSCIGIENKDTLDDFAKRLISKHKIQADELKSVNICKSKRYIVPEIIEFIISNKGKLLIEVVDKKYQLCAELMNYYILTPYLENVEEYTDVNIQFNRFICDTLYSKISEEQLNDFIFACQTVENESLEYVDKCFENVKNISKLHIEISSLLLSFIDDAKEVFDDFKKRYGIVIAKKKFTPLPDISGDKKYSILPNVTSLANIYARINKIEGAEGEFEIYHDEQKEFNFPLEDIISTTDELSSESSLSTPIADFNIQQNKKIEFKKSHDDFGVQLADVIAGAFMRHVLSVRNGDTVYSEFVEAYKMVVENPDELSIGANFVAPTELLIKLAETSKK